MKQSLAMILLLANLTTIQAGVRGYLQAVGPSPLRLASQARFNSASLPPLLLADPAPTKLSSTNQYSGAGTATAMNATTEVISSTAPAPTPNASGVIMGNPSLPGTFATGSVQGNIPLSSPISPQLLVPFFTRSADNILTNTPVVAMPVYFAPPAVAAPSSSSTAVYESTPAPTPVPIQP